MKILEFLKQWFRLEAFTGRDLREIIAAHELMEFELKSDNCQQN